jgi:uncharacterized membrane protein YeaQ/YmgE (transglycosylase-associated protein family)
VDFLYYLLIGLAAGWLAGQVLKGHDFGLLGNLVVGVVGAFLGAWLFALAGITSYGLFGALVWATVGAIALLLFLSSLKRIR